jgi:hypothetical protein
LPCHAPSRLATSSLILPLVHTTVRYTHAGLHAERADRTVIISPDDAQFMVSCFTQHVSGQAAEEAGVNEVLVMKVDSFSPSAPEGQDGYLPAWEGFIGNFSVYLLLPGPKPW